MTGVTSLWMPILVSAVLVFVVSSIIHMMTPWHKGDYPKVPDEDRVMDALRPFNLRPGDYMMPRPGSMADFKSPEFLEKMKKGPVVMFTVFPGGGTSMAPQLVGWFLYSVVVSTFAAYMASRTVPVGAPYLLVFRIVGTTAFVGYALALWQMTIWYRRALGTTVRSTIDGLVYACLTAGVFGWLWPR
jgi:hypothetical protein